jgi:D-alanyl-D-alanine carboxypeptidase/D-alanyl-D-alanine-endopeptidase (penicillin-binding protein 4)
MPALPYGVQQTVVGVQQEKAEEKEAVAYARPPVSQVEYAPQGTWQYAKQMALDTLCQSSLFKTSQLGLYVYDLTDGKPLYAVNAAHRMRPASCQKLVTAITALHFLKGNYQFHTDFRITGKVTKGTLQGDLIVVGGMDPMVSTDELLVAARQIKQQHGINSIAGSVVLDLTMREDTPYGWGWCWDDDYGPLSALLADGKDCFKQKWIEALGKANIKCDTAFTIKVHNPKAPRTKAAPASTSVYSIQHNIDELLNPMMKNSDNIFAECLFYQIAATSGKKGAGQKEAAKRTAELLENLGLNAEQYKVADGSGLSLYNYASAEMLVSLLGYAYQTESIQKSLLSSLPVAGFDGTLKKRMIGTEAEGSVRAKTGSVNGISSLAGYLVAANGHLLTFAIINQGIAPLSEGRAFQDKVCTLLCR